MFYYKGKIADTDITYAFRHKDTAAHFGDFLTEYLPEGPSDSEDIVAVPESDFQFWRKKWGFPADSFTEFGLSAYHTCNYMLKKKRVLFHAAAFSWKGKAYLLTAPSGTGKTTQLKHWISLHGDEITVINGDKPVLCADGNGNIMVCSSPWKGKERWGNENITAPLAGIVVLEQGKENSIRKLTVRESVPILIQRFLFTAHSKEQVLLAAHMEELLLKAVPVWLLTNVGDLASTELTCQTLMRERDDLR